MKKKLLLMFIIFLFIGTVAYCADNAIQDWSAIVCHTIVKNLIQEPMKLINNFSNVGTEKVQDLITKGQKVTIPVGTALLSLIVMIGFITRAAEIEGVTWTIVVKPIIFYSIGMYVVQRPNEILSIINLVINQMRSSLLIDSIKGFGQTINLDGILNNPASIISNLIPGVNIVAFQVKILLIVVILIISVLICACLLGIMISLAMRIVQMAALAMVAPLYFACFGSEGTASIAMNYIVGYFNAAFEVVVILVGLYVFANAPSIFDLKNPGGLIGMIIMLLCTLGAAIIGLTTKQIVGSIAGGAANLMSGAGKK